MSDVILVDLHVERRKYGATMNDDECATLINAVAWKHRADGWGLSGKKGGTVGRLRDGDKTITVAHDILHHKPTNLLYDVLEAAGAASKVVRELKAIGPPEGSNRPWVAPIAPEDGTTTPAEPSSNDILADLHVERRKYGATMSNDECVELCNIVAWKHRADGWGVNGRQSGTFGTRYDGERIARDILHHKPTDLRYDVLEAAGAASKVVRELTAISPEGAGPWVAPIAPEGTATPTEPVPTPTEPVPPTPTPALKNRLVFADEFRQVNEFYAHHDGLQRTGGMVVGAGQWAFDILDRYAKGEAFDHQQLREAAAEVQRISADTLAMVQWGYDLMTGRSVADVLAAIRETVEWSQKHPGQKP